MVKIELVVSNKKKNLENGLFEKFVYSLHPRMFTSNSDSEGFWPSVLITWAKQYINNHVLAVS